MKQALLALSFFGILAVLPDTVQAVSIDKFRLNGFIDMEYEKSYADNGSLGDTKGSFDQAHFNLLMEFLVSDSLTVRGHVEYEHGPMLSGTEPGTGDVSLEWAYLEYLLNNTTRLRGGLVLTPFGLYNEIHDATPTYLPIRVP